MRIRTMKPAIRSDETVCAWDFRTRWTFAGLFMYCDDEGRGRDNIRLLKADLYPLDDAVTLRAIEADLSRIAEAGPLCRYEVDGKRYLHLINWRHQRVNRPTPSEIPPCPMHEKEVNGRSRSTDNSVSRKRPLTPDAPTGQGMLTDDAVSDQGARTEDSRQEGKGKEGKGKDLAAAAPQQRARDEIWDAVVTACKIDMARVTEQQRGALSRVVKELRAVAATPAQIAAAARKWQRQYADKTLTPTALARHWGQLGDEPAAERRRQSPTGPGWSGYDPLGSAS